MKQSKILKNMILPALFAALTFVLTMIHIPSPASGGYIHLGDCMIYLSAAILPLPYACIAGAIGGGLSDLMSGAAQWILITVIVKALLAIAFTSKSPRFICKRNMIALLIGCFITVGGYFLGGWILNGFAGAIAEIPGNLFQSIGSGILYLLFAAALDRTAIKQKVQH